ncbi:MAG: DUF47 family protein [Eggerthellaceae bacterium]|nr:DUF47 family protein [Eggerthellaceae bacterium]
MAKKDKFDYFNAFEQLTHLAVEEADLLIQAIEEYTTPDNLLPHVTKAHELEHRGDVINHEIFTNIATDFITPLEREDLVGITQNLDNVLDYLEDVFQCFYMYDIQFMQEDALDFAKLIKNSCEALDTAMGNFRNFKKNRMYREYIVNVNDYEEEADQLYLQTIRKLFKTYRDKPLVAHVWADIFNRMEKCSDATEHVADVMSTVYLKNS